MSYIKCGDSKELLKQIPDKSVDLVVIDPPYLFDSKVGGGNSVARKSVITKITQMLVHFIQLWIKEKLINVVG